MLFSEPLAMSMYTYKASSSKQDLGTVIIHSSADIWKVNSLIDELKHRAIEVTAVQAESDLDHLDAFLHRCVGRCIVYLSSQPVSDLYKNSVLGFAARRGRDAVVVVTDDTMEILAGEWIDFICFRYEIDRREELCRELALLIRTPLLSCRPRDITGYAAAFRVLNGYLRFVLPNFHERLKELYPDVYASCVKKLLIIYPESCCCPPLINIKDSVEHADKYVLRNITRAGQQHRDISASVYSIRDEERSRDYYCAIEFDNSLGRLSNIQKSGLVGNEFDEARMHRERNNYILHLKQLLKHSARKYRGQYRMAYWRDRDISLEEFLVSVVREELENEPQQVFESPIDFPCFDGRGVNPGSLYANPAECYNLDREPKGICLIINMAEFESSTSTDNAVPPNLPPRAGTEDDVCQLEGVFKWLKFKVQVRINIKEPDFRRIIKEIQELDHTAYDAFVCCIMSHGYLGHIYTADGQSMKIIEDIAHAFYPESCPTLAGKPKIFFIQSCQVSNMCGFVAGQGVADDGEHSASETTTYESDAEKGTASLENRRRTLLLPDAPDFFMSYSTLPRNSSFRDPIKGTFYVQAVTEVLKKCLELQDSLHEVAQRVEQNVTAFTNQQRPFFYVSTDHKFVFLCGKLFAVSVRSLSVELCFTTV